MTIGVLTGAKPAGPICHYRVAGPFTHARGAGKNIWWSKDAGIRASGPIEVLDSNTGIYKAPEVLGLHRIMGPEWVRYAAQARKAGQRIVCDLDDLFWSIPASHRAQKTISPTMVRAFLDILAVADRVICSTPYLATELKRKLRRKCPEIVVVENLIDLDRFSPRRPRGETTNISVGWPAAMEYRDNDLYPVALDLEYFFTVNPGCQAVHIDKVAFENYPAALSRLDVGVAPLFNSPFNRAKSALKGLEFAALSIPFICSANPEYSRLFPNQVTDADKWAAALGDLRALAYRREMAAEVREVAITHAMSERWGDYVNAYTF